MFAGMILVLATLPAYAVFTATPAHGLFGFINNQALQFGTPGCFRFQELFFS
jgi:hypothetical protein